MNGKEESTNKGQQQRLFLCRACYFIYGSFFFLDRRVVERDLGFWGGRLPRIFSPPGTKSPPRKGAAPRRTLPTDGRWRDGVGKIQEPKRQQGGANQKQTTPCTKRPASSSRQKAVCSRRRLFNISIYSIGYHHKFSWPWPYKKRI